LTGDESVAAEVRDIEFPQLLTPVDDLPPATIVTHARITGGRVFVQGVSHDDGEVAKVTVNGRPALATAAAAGVVDWTIELPPPADGRIVAVAVDEAGNVEPAPHRVELSESGAF
jgi:hypothetical protein